jgi:hypothetical protein
MKMHPTVLYRIYKKLGIERNRKPSWYNPLRDEAIQLREQGMKYQKICDLFNSRGIKSLGGQSWTRKLVFNMVSEGRRSPNLGKIHREAFLKAEARGLSTSEMAKEFNEMRIPRQNKRPWTPAAIRSRRWTLKHADRTESNSANQAKEVTKLEYAVPEVTLDSMPGDKSG